ncbi:carbon starvation CstA 5TM domain-containing protein [Colwelliaceae bacterium BS250]
MIYLLLAISLLIMAYIIHGTFVEKVFWKSRNLSTPAFTNNTNDDGDVMPISTGKVYINKLLNRVGAGPIFGPMLNRLLLALPLFVIGAILSQFDFSVIWRYFGVANQATAALMLWIAAVYLLQQQKNHWVFTLPAMFMTTIVLSLLFHSKTLGLGLSLGFSIVMAGLLTVLTTFSIASRITIKSRNTNTNLTN